MQHHVGQLTESDPGSPGPNPGNNPRVNSPGPSRLTKTVLDIERHVAAGAWDQPPRLYALVETADLRRREPQLVGPDLGTDADEPGHLTAIEQEELPDFAAVEELLGGIAWPAEVLGAALVVERLFLPASHEGGMPAEEEAALAWLAEHPHRQELRIAAAVLRDGSRECALRLRSRDADASVLTGSDLVPGLTDALAATLAD